MTSSGEPQAMSRPPALWMTPVSSLVHQRARAFSVFHERLRKKKRPRR
jgi:hypothetical protein